MEIQECCVFSSSSAFTGMFYLSWDTDFRVFSLSFVNYVDSVDENVLQAAPEIWGWGQVRQILLDNTANI